MRERRFHCDLFWILPNQKTPLFLPLRFTPEMFHQCDWTQNAPPPPPVRAREFTQRFLCVFCAGTPSIGAPTWTECSTSMRATGRCTSSESWTARKTRGTTSLSPPQSSVSSAQSVFCSSGKYQEEFTQYWLLFVAQVEEHSCFCLLKQILPN